MVVVVIKANALRVAHIVAHGAASGEDGEYVGVFRAWARTELTDSRKAGRDALPAALFAGKRDLRQVALRIDHTHDQDTTRHDGVKRQPAFNDEVTCTRVNIGPRGA